jgi:hypothetical protein
MEMNLVRTSIVQIGQLIQNSPKVNGNGAKRKQQADRHNLCKFLDGQALFSSLFHMYAEIYKEMRDSLQPSSTESGQDDVSQAEQNKRRKGDKLKMNAAPKSEVATSNLPKPTADSKGITSLRHSGLLPMENGETGSEENAIEIPGTSESTGQR